jgi:hypothetical protein
VNRRLLIALILVLLPIVARGIWFYRGVYVRESAVPMPDYRGVEGVPAPPISTPFPAAAGEHQPETDPQSGSSERGVVLVDMGHQNRFEIAEIEPLLDVLTGWGARVETIGENESDGLATTLKYADALVVVAPLTPFTQEEVAAVRRFVSLGGRLLVLSEPTRFDASVEESVLFNVRDLLVLNDVAATNSLLVPYDIAFSNDYLYNTHENEGNYRNVFFSQFAPNALNSNLSRLAFYAARSVGTTTGQPLIIGDEHTYSSLTDTAGQHAVAALSEDGQVLAIGDMSFLSAPYNQVADNQQFIANLAGFLVGAPRQHTLSDFPYLWERPVALVPMGNEETTMELLQLLGTLQHSLEQSDMEVTLAAAPQPEHDLLTVGLYTSTLEVQSYLRPFSMTITSTVDPISGTLTIPDMGDMSFNGVGLILLSETTTRTDVMVLAQSSEFLKNMLGFLALDTMEQCITMDEKDANGQHTIAICQAGEPVDMLSLPMGGDQGGGEGGFEGESEGGGEGGFEGESEGGGEQPPPEG